jgi:hypothetical protein
MSVRIAHPGKLLAFVLLSLADLFLTWLLVSGSDGEVYESNPVAGFCLNLFGWLGLGVYKFLSVTLVSTLVLIISRSRPRAGGRILVFACVSLTAVVLYSCFLAWSIGLATLPEPLAEVVGSVSTG